MLTFGQTQGDPLYVVSSRSDAVSGNEVLVGIAARLGQHRTVWLNGRDVTASFHRTESGEVLALLTKLNPRDNLLEFRVAGVRRAKLKVINHPISGPIFSGPQQQPFLCQTALNGLGPPAMENCEAPTRVEYYYKSKQPAQNNVIESWEKGLEVLGGAGPVVLHTGFKAYDLESPPTDVAQTVTTDGRIVPYIVRREIGTINRAVYDIRFLHTPGQPLPTPWGRGQSAWNGRLVYELAGGCVSGHRQGTLISPGSHEAILARGFAVATATLNIFANTCNDVLSAETLSMVKEHFIKELGSPVHTIGWGDSAGAAQQYLIAQNYPGLLDGIVPYISFPDTVTYVSSSSDCSLLIHAFDNAKHPWTDEQRTAATGFATWRVCAEVQGFAIDSRACELAAAEAGAHESQAHSTGTRCDIYDNEINVFGRDAGTGRAARPLDNVGVQYGLGALNSGEIDAEQFVELNELAGGFDADGNVIGQRTDANPDVIQRAYRNGVVLTGGGGLSQIPIIDWRWYSDDQGDHHDSFRSFVTRARLLAASGTAANQVILIDARANTAVMTLSRLSDPNPDTSAFARRERYLIGQMDRWLDNIEADRAPGLRSAKVARDRPPDLENGCWATDGKWIVEKTGYSKSTECGRLYPPHADPRIVAGGPLTDDVLKCVLRPIDPAQYVYRLNDAQLQRLRTVFPTGVCDYSRPGVGQELSGATWRRY
jgi:hypothetical protein